MDMTTRVAHCIAKAYKQMIASVPNGPSDLLAKYIKDAVNHPHPQDRVVMSYSINRGDVFRPVGIAPVFIAGDLLTVAPSQRYIIFRLSCPSFQHDLMDYSNDESVRSIILQYLDVGDILDITQIQTVISCGSHHSLIPLLSVCELVDNVAAQL